MPITFDFFQEQLLAGGIVGHHAWNHRHLKEAGVEPSESPVNKTESDTIILQHKVSSAEVQMA